MTIFKSESNRSYKQLWQWLLLVCVALSILFFTSFDIVQTVEKTKFTVFLIEKTNSILIHTITFVGIFWILNKIKSIIFSRISLTKFICILVLSAFFSLFSVLSVYFDSNFSVSLLSLLSSLVSLFSFVTAFFGGIVFFFAIIRMIWYFLEEFKGFKKPECNRLVSFFGDHLYRNCIIVIALCWLPQYIIRFPGAVPYDVWQSVAMHLGYIEITTQHPLIWGALVGYLTQLGEIIGINWLAPLVLCLIQHVLSILTITYIIATFKKFNFNSWFLAVALGFFIIMPPMWMYASTMYNDCFYYLSIMLLTTELMYYLYDRESYFSEIRHLILSMLAVFGSIFRYNGFYTMLVVLAVVTLRELVLVIKRRTKIKQAVTVVIVCLLIPLLCGQILQTTLNDAFDATEIRGRAMLSVPIQQSVRCLVEYGDTIDKEDYDALHTVLTWSDEEYAQWYNPRNFDSVKESFKNDATKEELSAFIKAWSRLVLKYPKTCFMATANQTYYLFSPLVDNVRYYESLSAHTEQTVRKYGFDATPYTLSLPVLNVICRLLFHFETRAFSKIPLLGLIVNPAVYTILLFVICLAGLFRKDKRVLILTVSLLVTLAITFLGPAVFSHPRYVYPIMFSMPILIAAFRLPQKNNGE